MVDSYLSILRRYWGYEDFRGIQREIIESIGAGRDTLGLMPTGGGKSITFQIPALAKTGVCIVITPLIALMKDQVQALNSRGIKAAFINSSQSREQSLVVMENAIFGAYKFLYVSPERLSSQLFLQKLSHMNVSFITIDEAHCICQWGYDFRPSYLQIAQIRKVKPACPILALTATATPEVVTEIQRCLQFKEENVFRMSFFRSNLAYQVRFSERITEGIVEALETIPGSCIIYSRNRQNCKDMAVELEKMGYLTTYYHAGLKNSDKNQRQDDWLHGKKRIMVATNAFGMGIDKPDVRLVIHVDLPDSIEEYFQEAGRAGRDGKKSYSIILTTGRNENTVARRTAQQFPQPDYIRDVYERLCFFYGLAVGDGLNVTREFNVEQFCRTFHYYPVMLKSALEILDKSGYIEYRDAEEGCSRIRIVASRRELIDALDEQGQLIVSCLMRHYGGIFVDYLFIDEDLICRETGLSMDVIYQDLVEMDRRNLIGYIPKKNIPKVTFCMRRVDKSDIVLPQAVYQLRKDKFQSRLMAIYSYATTNDDCRSRILLRYFGEHSSHDCGICDICLSRHPEPFTANDFETIRQHILRQLKSGPVKYSEIDTRGIDRKQLKEVVDYLCAKEELMVEGYYLRRGSK